jgi:hypothetical protein
MPSGESAQNEVAFPHAAAGTPEQQALAPPGKIIRHMVLLRLALGIKPVRRPVSL